MVESGFVPVCVGRGFMPYSAIYDLSFQPLFGKVDGETR